MVPLNVGFIGYGFATKCFHLPYIIPNPDLNVYAFLQRAESPPPGSPTEKGKHCTIDYPDAKHYRTATEFFADPNIELVIVCTHHDSHTEYAEKALLAGKHVVVEKPFTPTAAEADNLIALAKDKAKLLTVFQNRRYDSDFRTLYEIANKGAFGELTDVTIHYDVDFPPWIAKWKGGEYKPGDGIMFGLGSHSVDQALLLIGTTPTSVTGFYRTLRDSESDVDDTFIIILQFGGALRKLIATVTTSVVTRMENPLKFLVRGYDGSFLKYGEDPQEPQLMAGMQSTDPKFGVEDPSIHGQLVTKVKIHESQTFDDRIGRYIGVYPSLNGSYMKYYEDVVEAIKIGKEPFVKAQQSRDGIRVIELARQSAQEGRSIPWS
ncbi:Alpha-N-acetylgalactosaminidase [Dactylella cylindrospora]|nr:Alpha-N-acetylgalactosaminidase [Dactylella cylindrospora]